MALSARTVAAMISFALEPARVCSVYMCQICGRTFMDNGALPGMRLSPEVIGAAVSMFYGGLSIREVRNNLDQIFDVKPSKSTIYGWLIRYTKKAKRLIGDVRPRVGDVWEADKMASYIEGIERVFGASSRHVQSGRFKLELSTTGHRAVPRVVERPHEGNAGHGRPRVGETHYGRLADLLQLFSRA